MALRGRTTSKAFTAWDYSFITTLAASSLDDTMKASKAFYDGDHWQNGEAWKGPKPDPLTTDTVQATAFMEKVRQSFTSANVIREIVDRHVAAVVGKSPGWQMVRNDATMTEDQEEAQEADDKVDPLVAEIEAAITDWCDQRNVLEFITSAAANMETVGRGFVRLFVPTGKLKAGQVPKCKTAAEALSYLFIEDVDSGDAGIITYRDTMTQGAYSIIKDLGGDTENQTTVTEVQYVEGDQLVVQVWKDSNPMPPVKLAVKGLLAYEMGVKPLVTEQLRQLQGGLNFSLTAMGRNNSSAGFSERVIMNAQLPGEYVGEGSKKQFKPTAYKGGPGATTFMTGVAIYDDEGKITGYATPSMERYDPASPESFTESERAYRAAMYMEAKQGHLLIQNDGSASAASRIQLRADFATSLRDTKTQVEGVYRWLLSTLANVAGVFMGDAKKYAELRPAVQVSIDTGPLSDMERTAILDEFKEGLRSRETSMVLIGVEDPDAEMTRIRAEQPTNPISLEVLATLFSLTDLLTGDQLAQLLIRGGIKDADATELTTRLEEARQQKNAAATARQKLLNPADANPGGGDPAAGSGGA